MSRTSVALLSMPEARFAAMGCDVHVALEGGAHLLDVARSRIEDLDRRWSRFRPDSEMSRLNAASGPLTVSADTFALLEVTVLAHCLTGGRFDPTVLPALLAAGYDRDIVAVRETPGPWGPPACAPGLRSIRLDAGTRTVTLPAGVTLDVGGIAKGHAAELVAQELVDLGAVGAIVNLGGDLAVAGEAPVGGWPVRIADPCDLGRNVLTLRLHHGAVATSSAVRRAWGRGRRRAHHVIDPQRGRPADVVLRSVTAVAAQGWRAEALATAGLLAGPRRVATLLRSRGAAGVVVDERGGIRVHGAIEVAA